MSETSGFVIESTPEVFYDLAEGRLAVGQLAVDSIIETGTHPADIIPLGSMLEDKTKVLSDLYEKIDVDAWEKADYLTYGRWLYSVVTSDNPQSRLTRRILARASSLGVGPSERRITDPKRFGTFAAYYKELGVKRSIIKGVYNDWSFEQSMDYVRSTALKAEKQVGRPSLAYFEGISNQGRGPSRKVLKENTGHSLGALLDMAGYPNVHEWEYDDFIDWGVRFMVANDGRAPDVSSMRLLSSRGRGPSVATISDHRHFGGIKNYRKVVVDAYQQKIEGEYRVRQDKLERIRKQSEAGVFPETLINDSNTDDELLAYAARYWIVDKLLPGWEESRKYSAARNKNPNNLVKTIQAHDRTITEGQVQATALVLQVFDEVWPTDTTTEMLKVA